MERAVGHGLQAAPWEQQEAGDPHAHVRRAAGFFAWSQTEPGHGCPISMTYAAVPALRVDEAIAKEWTPLLAARSYDPGVRAARDEDRRAGRHGHDREAGRLRRPRQRDRGATPTADDGWYTLHGHKWFTSAPMNDVFLVLAQADGGVTCFVVPRVLADGDPQPARRRAAQGQARQPLQRLLRARARRHARPSASATRAAASARSSRWSPPPGSTACSARRR